MSPCFWDFYLGSEDQTQVIRLAKSSLLPPSSILLVRQKLGSLKASKQSPTFLCLIAGVMGADQVPQTGCMHWKPGGGDKVETSFSCFFEPRPSMGIN